MRRPLPQLRARRSFGRTIERYVDPAVIFLWLLGMAIWFDELADAKFVVAEVLGFALAYPGTVQLTDPPAVVMRKSFMTAVGIVAGLSLFIFASSWLKFEPRSQVLPCFAALPPLLFVAHMATRFGLRKVSVLRGVTTNVVICGVNEIGERLATHFATFPYFGARFLGFFDDRHRDRLTQIGDRPLLGKFSELGEYIRRHRVDQVYFALPMATQPRIMNMLRDSEDSTAAIFFAPDIFVTDIINGRVTSIAGLPVVSVRDTPLDGPNHVVKRIEDVVLSGACLALAAPVMLLVALGVKLTSPGSVLFRQKRYGLDGREFVIWKFRSMTVTEDGSRSYTQVKRGDARVTPLGRFIRRTSLDELPQLVNVLQGRMSLVGPRPHVVAVNEELRKLIPSYMVRHMIKPGLTGLAQVRGFRGGDDFEGMRNRVDSDIEYVRNWSLFLDFEIVLRTFALIWRDRKAF